MVNGARGPKTEFAQLEKARTIHEEAALRSASWGLFQIMGFNYAAAGFETVIEFVAAMETGEGASFLPFVGFWAATRGCLRRCVKKTGRFSPGYTMEQVIRPMHMTKDCGNHI